MNWKTVLAGVAGLTGITASASALPIRDIPNLVSVQVFEATGGETLFNMTPTGAVVTTKLPDRLAAGSGNNDFQSASNEFYDFFYSDADGTFNPFGAFLTITAIFDNEADSGLNVTRARLVSQGPGDPVATIEYAGFVASFVALGALPFPGTATNALGDTPGTTTFLGDTAGQPDNVRLRLTLGFDSTRPQDVNAPASLALVALGLLGAGAMRRRRRR